MEQLLLFSETDEDKLRREVSQLREQCDKIRKGQFAKIGELTRMYLELQHEFNVLKSVVCTSSEKKQMDLFQA